MKGEGRREEGERRARDGDRDRERESLVFSISSNENQHRDTCEESQDSQKHGTQTIRQRRFDEEKGMLVRTTRGSSLEIGEKASASSLLALHTMRWAGFP